MRLPRPSRTFAWRLPWNRRLWRRGPRPPDVSPLDVWSTSVMSEMRKAIASAAAIALAAWGLAQGPADTEPCPAIGSSS